MLDRLKALLRDGLGLAPDAILVFLGLGIFLATCLIGRRPLTWAWALLPGLGLALFLEAVEVWQHYGAQGLKSATAAQLAGIVLRHARDLLVMNLAPVMVFGAAVLLQRLSQD